MAELRTFVVTATAPWAPVPRVFVLSAANEREAEDRCYKRHPELLQIEENCGEEYEVEVRVYATEGVDFIEL